MKNFVEELKWRGMIQDIMPGTEEKLMEGPTAAYVGIDPTADSLHIGHMVSIMTVARAPASRRLRVFFLNIWNASLVSVHAD